MYKLQSQKHSLGNLLPAKTFNCKAQRGREKEGKKKDRKITFLPIMTMIFESDGWVIAFFMFGYLPYLLIITLVTTYRETPARSECEPQEFFQLCNINKANHRSSFINHNHNNNQTNLLHAIVPTFFRKGFDSVDNTKTFLFSEKKKLQLPFCKYAQKQNADHIPQ